jgi:hypothetical protein
MRKRFTMTKRLTLILGTALLTIVLAPPAYASPGNGNGSENGNGAANANSQAASHSAPAPSSAPDSAGPPGQVKKADQAQANGANSASPSHAKSNAAAETKSYKTASSAGVKPSNSTAHNTSATAGSNSTKLYGNGQTAGQIAIHSGASTNAVLYGPGNSQPHKTAPCGEVVHGKGGGFDVHALKSHAKDRGCGAVPTATVPKDAATSTPRAQTGRLTASTSASGPAVSPSNSNGVKGAATEDDHAESGVLGSLGTAGEATLPFTGFSLAAVALVALALVAAGLSLRRQAVAAA